MTEATLSIKWLKHLFPRNRTGWAAIAFLATSGLSIAVKFAAHKVPDGLEHLLLVLTAVTGVHLLDRAYLVRDIADYFKTAVREASDLANQVTTTGIVGCFSSRAKVQSTATELVDRASKRVWLLGVAFSQQVSLPALLPVLTEKIDRGIDVRVLLLDGLRSTSVFRTVLESSHEDAKAILETNRRTPPTPDPYFRQRLYRDFEWLCNTLSDFPAVERSVRFYGHAPLCWLVICDDTALYQPYTFGRGLSRQGNLSIGDQIPVFEVQRHDGGHFFETLEDHFWKLWVTSDLSLFHIEARRADRVRILKRIFDDRVWWLKHVSAVLALLNHRDHTKRDRRFEPRQPCEATPKGLTITWDDSGSAVEVPARIVDCSRSGIGIIVEGQTLPTDKTIIRLGDDAIPDAPLAARFMMSELRRRHDNKFIVRWAKADKRRVGIEGLTSSATSPCSPTAASVSSAATKREMGG